MWTPGAVAIGSPRTFLPPESGVHLVRKPPENDLAKRLAVQPNRAHTVRMKARYVTRCEKCKSRIDIGTSFIRFHARPWCVPCTVEYLRMRKRAKELVA